MVYTQIKFIFNVYLLSIIWVSTKLHPNPYDVNVLAISCVDVFAFKSQVKTDNHGNSCDHPLMQSISTSRCMQCIHIR